MATSYSALKTEITNWTHRSDLTSHIDTFIDMAEAKMNRTLRMSEMEDSTAIAYSGSDISLPDGFLEMREIHVSSSPDTTLEFVAPFKLSQLKQSGAGGIHVYYTIRDDAIELYPTGSCTVEMVFYKEITPLDDTNTSNFVLADSPDLYFHGCMHNAYMYMRDVDSAAMHSQEFERIAEQMNKMSNRRKFSGPLQVRTA